jgi:hypothetical protein
MDKLPAQLTQIAQGANVDEKVVNRTIGIIDSMTPAERSKPELIKASRKRRIAKGAGVPVPVSAEGGQSRERRGGGARYSVMSEMQKGLVWRLA